MEHATELRGLLVVTRDEGAQLGTISAVFIDTDQKRVAALGYRTRRVGGDEFYVPMSEVKVIGKDVVLISSKSAARKITDTERAPGKSLKKLQGFWVTSADGHHLGPLVDLDFSSDWKICELRLSNDRALPVNPDELRIGDEILVPVHYAEKIRTTNGSRGGLLRRIFRSDSLDDTKKVLRRVLGRSSEPSGQEGREPPPPPAADSHPPS